MEIRDDRQAAYEATTFVNPIRDAKFTDAERAAMKADHLTPAIERLQQRFAEIEEARRIAEEEASWTYGYASAYGGSSDPSSGTRTATGATVSDWSMGVALPMSMPGYRSHFGQQVEIDYNGHRVIATVNDCGGMNNGGRALDLQPGVFKALGAGSCQSWGVRYVKYRFL